MRYITAGESHGPQLTTIIEGVPAGLSLVADDINEELARRQKGYGRGRRMQIETDQVQILSGVRHGETLGSPIALVVENRDFAHWTKIMGAEPLTEQEEKEMKRKVTKPRPGHADLNGAIKYGHRDMRNVLERSSARETTVRVAAGAVAKKVLAELGIKVAGHVIEIGGVQAKEITYSSIEELKSITEASPVRCLDDEAGNQMMKAIDDAKANGDSIGGIVEVIVEGMPIGVGSYVHYDRKLDAKLAAAIMSINAFKGVEIGIGFEAAHRPGSEVHDEILWNEEHGYTRRTNNAGGLEGGMTTGMPIVVRGVMKPIPTLYKPLQSVDIDTKEPFTASIERSDSCAVPAASVVAEAVVAWELATALIEQFGLDRMELIRENIEKHNEYARGF
ncbi:MULTISPECIES: chorismate synthase [Bacillus]|jgi:chorismate synthase|uniref:Chorismate synthase 1 n=17 Tax=Bacilli TaxID=91061 RepID=AROC1_BACCR|nr:MULTISPECIES: chorismate synthase [Bacillus]Q81FQ3.1 RecName: Full=Chorismate synthase 1; Short=CS 1; AltName: Full=5-enolpyruvylshikimate-3-phosphate phospholyase 1 [Bacillus cereus ATCC 14579]MCO4215015.1 chorismate synthase [Bacillus sp. 10017]MCX2700928.1 chorismate synthase [Bacillus sp. AS_5]MDV8114275.1 chorismate synthase [Bacillus sp. BAU-SS-2023]MEB4840853.1 chorismate synthase [Paenibacillus jamilae]TKV48548.1 chorismate synthase [Bacillus sp. PIC28]CEX42600.1 chorismate syntha